MKFKERLQDAYQGKTVLVTGHTGFKGAWLCEWLLKLGARVVGVALPPNTEPALFDQLGLASRVEHHLQDIRDREALTAIVLKARPEYLFHLAAQPLVRLSYAEPVETYTTNLLGTVNLLEALRQLDAIYRKEREKCSSVLITTDKCYANREWLQGYREEDPLGGYDPYSSSKACAELAIASWRQSFFNPEHSAEPIRIGIASARAGNVIGGGDWALDRIIPDCIRHLTRDKPIPVRNPAATRPWQHVMEPLSGYLTLAMRQRYALVSEEKEALVALSSAFNFGPGLGSNRSVKEVVEEALQCWPGDWEDHQKTGEPHEAGKLNLAWDKAFHLLDWQPRWEFPETLARTINWYRQQMTSGVDAGTLIRGDIEAYES